VGKLIRCG